MAVEETPTRIYQIKRVREVVTRKGDIGFFERLARAYLEESWRKLLGRETWGDMQQHGVLEKLHLFEDQRKV